MKICVPFVLAFALVGCGGSKQTSEPPAQSPPKLPPSMAGGSGASTPGSPDVPAQNAVGSEEIAKGQKALDAGDLTSAKSYADAALKKNPMDAEAFALLGEIAEKSNDK